MTRKSLYATIDTREPQVWKDRFTKFFANEGYEVTYEALQYGDVETEKTILERKTIYDFVSSLMDSRLDKQMNGLASVAERSEKVPILLVHGRYYDLLDIPKFTKGGGTRIIQQVHGAMASAICRYGVILIWIENENDAAEVAVKLISKIDDEKFMIPRKVNKVAMLARILELTPKTTRDLLKACGGSICGLCEADEKTLLGVKGIGKVKASRIREILYNVLWEV